MARLIIIITSLATLVIVVWKVKSCSEEVSEYAKKSRPHLGINIRDKEIIKDSVLNEFMGIAGYSVYGNDFEFASYPMKDSSHLSVWRLLKKERTDLSESFLIKPSKNARLNDDITYVKDAFGRGNSYLNMHKSHEKQFEYILIGGNFEIYANNIDTLHFEGKFDFMNLSNSIEEDEIKYQGLIFEYVPKNSTQEVIVFNDRHGLIICTYIGKESERIENLLK